MSGPHSRLLEALDVAVVIATGAADSPRIARAWGPEVVGPSLTLCVEAPTSSHVCDNLVAGSTIAVTFMRPSTYCSLQIKGPIAAIAEPTAEQFCRAERHRDGFVADGELVGLSPRRALDLFDPSSLISVSLVAVDFFDQTPGPGAGEPIGGGELLGGGCGPAT